jgi:hypothetical protein
MPIATGMDVTESLAFGHWDTIFDRVAGVSHHAHSFLEACEYLGDATIVLSDFNLG